MRWYLRYGLSYRDLEELLAERGIEVDHVTLYRWVQRFTPLLINAARPCRRAAGDRWFVDETYVKVAGVWCYVYRAVDQHGQVPDAEHSTDQYANNRIECDHGRLKTRLRPMRGLKSDRTASVVIRGHSLLQNIRRGHYEFDNDSVSRSRLEAVFDELLPTLRH